MHPEHKASLVKALDGQSWNKNLSRKLIAAIEKDLRKPKETKKLSALQLAVQKEKGVKLNSGTQISDHTED